MSDNDPSEDVRIDYDRLADAMIQRLSEAGLSRRQMLSLLAVGGAGAIGFGAGTAAADEPAGTLYVEQLGTESEPVTDIYVDNFNDNVITAITQLGTEDEPLETLYVDEQIVNDETDHLELNTIEFPQTGQFEIQIDGQDGDGIINFETED